MQKETDDDSGCVEAAWPAARLRPRSRCRHSALLVVMGLVFMGVTVFHPPPLQAQSNVTLTAGNIHGTGTTLTISGHTGAWRYKQDTNSPFVSCSSEIPAGTSTVVLSGLDPNQSYTFKAYSSYPCDTQSELTDDSTDAEFTTSRVVLSTGQLFVNEQGSSDYTVKLATAPTASVTLTLSSTGDSDLTFDTDPVTSGNQDSLSFTTSDWETLKTVKVSAADDINKTNDTALITHTAASDDTDYSGVTSVLTAIESDDDICQGTTAVGNLNSGGLVDDCNTLLAAKAALSGSSTRLADWSTDTSIGSWTGVTVANNRVTRLSVRGPVNRLSGSIPAKLSDLSSLTVLDLGGNRLSGAIPTELGDLTNLTTLNLAGNQLTGAIPTELGDLTNLTELNLGGNRLTGAIPTELGDLTNLTTLDLGRNLQLSGAIPTELGDLTSLTKLDLGNNRLTGAIPTELGDLANLTRLDLAGNQLTGTIPADLGDLISLTELDLANNQLTGAIPSALGNLINLVKLRLDRNQLTEDVPSELNNLDKVTFIGLERNNLTGCFPPIFQWNTPTAYLNPQNNDVNLPWCAGLALYRNKITIPEGNTFTWYGMSLATAPTHDVTVNASISGDSDIVITSGQSLTFTPDDYDPKSPTVEFVIMKSNHDADSDDGIAVITHTVTSEDSAYNNLTTTVTVTEADDDKGLYASDLTETSAVLRIKNHTGTWYYRQFLPSVGQCSAAISSETTTVSGLNRGTSYTFKAYSNSNCSTELTTALRDAEFTTLALPDAPASATTTRANGKLKVTWPSATDATGYNVQLSYDDRATWTRVATNLSATTFTMTDTSLDTTAYAAVQSVNNDGVSAWTHASPAGPAPPHQPQTVTAAWDKVAETLTISWNHAPQAVTYNVSVSYDHRKTWTRLASDLSATTLTVTNATLNATAYAAVQSVNSNGASAWTNSGPVNTTQRPPDAPASVTVTWEGETLIVTWEAAERAAGYDVSIHEHRTGWRKVATGVTGTTITITDADTTGVVDVGVEAVNPGGKSKVTYSGSTHPIPPPDAPASVGTAWQDETLIVTWEAGARAISYDVNIHEHRTGWREVATGVTGTTLTITDADTTGVVVVAVRAVNILGRSGWAKSARTNPKAPPPAPGSVSAAWDGGQLVINWSGVDQATGYDVLVHEHRTRWRTIAANIQATTFSTSDVDSSGDLWVGVQSVNSGGTSNPTYALRVDPSQPLAQPDAPGSATATWKGGKLAISWSAANRATGYNVGVSTDQKTNWTQVGADVAGTTLNAAGFDTGAAVHVRVQAVNSAGTSTWTTSGAIDPPTTPPLAPASVTIAWKSGELAVSWSAVGRATGYNVSVSTDQQASWTQVGADVSGTTLNLTDIDTGATVHVRVQAVNSAGTSTWTTSGAIGPPTTPPGAPASVTIAWKSGELAISWSAVNGATGHNVIIHEHYAGWRTVATNVRGTTLTVSDADSSGRIWVGVESVNSAGTSPYAYEYIDPPPPGTKPDAPASVTVSRADGTVTATWDAPAEATKYHVTYSSDDGASWSLAASTHTDTTITINGLTNQETYIVGVRAGNTAGWSTWTNSPPAGPYNPPQQITKPDPPASVTLTRADGTITADWDAPAGATKYHVTYSSDDGASWSLAASAHTDTTITIDGLTNQETYIVGVRAGNTAGWSTWTNSPPAGPYNPPQQITKPDPPASVTLTRADGTVTADWDAPAGATSYHVTYSSDGGTSWSLAASAHTDTTITVDGLSNNETYIVGVRAGNTAGWSTWTNSGPADPYNPQTTQSPTPREDPASDIAAPQSGTLAISRRGGERSHRLGPPGPRTRPPPRL